MTSTAPPSGGGRAAGLRTIWLHTPDRDAHPPHADPDHHARSIPEAVAILLDNR